MKTEKHCKIHAQSASPYCVECYKDDLAKEQADDRLARTTCYRLLDHNDTIRADDEFLEDDCITWTLIGIQHRWNVGCYWHTALKPMRRILGDNVKIADAGMEVQNHLGLRRRSAHRLVGRGGAARFGKV